METPALSPALPPYTAGWFQIGWSADLAAGQLRKIRQFGRQYVLFRGADGRLGLLDDLCPHLGARFSEGGCVKGSTLQCPYHHWRFDHSGQCTDIPYAKKIPPKARAGAHTVLERHGLIFMYRDEDGAAPGYALPDFEGFDPAAYLRPARFEHRIRIHGQDIMENSVDSAHFRAVHGHHMPENSFRSDGRTLRVTQRTAVDRFGTTLRARLEFYMVEPGFHYVHFTELPGPDTFLFSSIVPIDGEYTNHRLTVWVRRSRIPLLSPVARRFLLWQMMRTYQEDMRIWESKVYLPSPVLCEGDGHIVKLRRWYAQFYDRASAA